MKMSGKISKLLSSGYATIIGAICAIFIGICFPEAGKLFTLPGNIFLTLISISVIPIIFSSVTCSIIKMISDKIAEITVSKIIFTFTSILILAGGIGILIGISSHSGETIMNSKLIANMVFQDVQNSIAEVSIFDPLDTLKKFSFADFISTLLPKNPFAAFAEGNIIQILSVSILVGFAISHLDSQKREISLRSLTVLMQSFKKILKIPTKILPIGMFCLLASNISKVNFEDMLAMTRFICGSFIAFSVLILLALFVFAVYSPIGFLKSIKSIKEAIIIAFSTCSNQATLPFLITALRDKFRLAEQAVDLAIPLGITMCRAGNVAYYAFVSIFIASVYNQPLSIYEQGFIILGSIMTSFASSGANGIIAISMISIILDPLNLPINSIILILVAVDPIIEPVRTITSLIMNAAVSCFIINGKRRRVQCK